MSEKPTSGFHTSAGANNQTHPPTLPKQRGQVQQPIDSGQVMTYCSITAPTQSRRHATRGIGKPGRAANTKRVPPRDFCSSCLPAQDPTPYAMCLLESWSGGREPVRYPF